MRITELTKQEIVERKAMAMAMLEVLDDYDWGEVFAFSGGEGFGSVGDIREAIPGQNIILGPFGRADVSEIIAMSPGQNDRESWMVCGGLNDGCWFFIEAGCCYTGWDCQAYGSTTIARTKAELIRFGLTKDARERMGLEL